MSPLHEAAFGAAVPSPVTIASGDERDMKGE
jgi:hypothetical protein